jgi:hypothetical protein
MNQPFLAAKSPSWSQTSAYREAKRLLRQQLHDLREKVKQLQRETQAMLRLQARSGTTDLINNALGDAGISLSELGRISGISKSSLHRHARIWTRRRPLRASKIPPQRGCFK